MNLREELEAEQEKVGHVVDDPLREQLKELDRLLWQVEGGRGGRRRGGREGEEWLPEVDWFLNQSKVDNREWSREKGTIIKSEKS
jgi:hypothetical protein